MLVTGRVEKVGDEETARYFAFPAAREPAGRLDERSEPPRSPRARRWTQILPRSAIGSSRQKKPCRCRHFGGGYRLRPGDHRILAKGAPTACTRPVRIQPRRGGRVVDPATRPLKMHDDEERPFDLAAGLSIICAMFRPVEIKPGHSGGTETRGSRSARLPVLRVVIVAWCVLLCASRSTSAATSELSGRYVMATSESSQEAYGGTISISARKNAYEMDWQLAGEYRSLHGLGMLEDRELLGVSISTGGGAYGVAVYHHAKNDPQWKGRWVTSIDGRRQRGRHRVRGRTRPSSAATR